jgi:hypothetical protein
LLKVPGSSKETKVLASTSNLTTITEHWLWIRDEMLPQLQTSIQQKQQRPITPSREHRYATSGIPHSKSADDFQELMTTISSMVYSSAVSEEEENPSVSSGLFGEEDGHLITCLNLFLSFSDLMQVYHCTLKVDERQDDRSMDGNEGGKGCLYVLDRSCIFQRAATATPEDIELHLIHDSEPVTRIEFRNLLTIKQQQAYILLLTNSNQVG